MNFSLLKSDIYQPLQKVINIISNKPRLPILSYILLQIKNNYLFITATNLEVEITARILLNKEYLFDPIMISGRKFFEICRNLPEQLEISISLKDNKIFINSGCSNFCLSTVSTKDFPKLQKYQNQFDIIISQLVFKRMIRSTYFFMARQDSRYCLNGIFVKAFKNSIRMVASDGYRLAMSEINVQNYSLLVSKSIIIPRKSILEILNLLNVDQEIVKIGIYTNYICIQTGSYIFNSQIIDATFPEYSSVFPKNPKNIFEIDRIMLKDALKRASVLSHTKHRIVNLDLSLNQLKVTTHNFDQDASEEVLKISYIYEDIQIAFNVDYLLDVIRVIDSQNLKFYILNAVSSVQIEGIPKCFGATYVVMPIKI